MKTEKQTTTEPKAERAKPKPSETTVKAREWAAAKREVEALTARRDRLAAETKANADAIVTATARLEAATAAMK